MGGSTKTSDAVAAAPPPSAPPSRRGASDPLLNTRQVESLLGMGGVTLWTWRKTGTFDVPPFYDEGGFAGAKLWRESDVLKWLAERPRRQDPSAIPSRRGGPRGRLPGVHLRPPPATRNIFSPTNHGLDDFAELRILRMPEVVKLVGVTRICIVRWEAAGKFPRRVHLGANSVGWYAGEVKAWLEARKRGRVALNDRVRQGVSLGGPRGTPTSKRRYLHLTAAQKADVIRRVQHSELPLGRMLAELGIPLATFYGWCRKAGVRKIRRSRKARGSSARDRSG